MKNILHRLLLAIGCLLIPGLTSAWTVTTHGSWQTLDFNMNPMDDHRAYGARSEFASPLQPMSFPWRDTRAAIYFQCDTEGHKSTYVRFPRV